MQNVNYDGVAAADDNINWILSRDMIKTWLQNSARKAISF